MAPTDENGRVLEKGGKPRRARDETRAAVERWDWEEDELGLINNLAMRVFICIERERG